MATQLVEKKSFNKNLYQSIKKDKQNCEDKQLSI